MPTYVYSFGKDRTDGRADMRNLLGGKGANLAEMSNLGLPVPPGFTISTEACVHNQHVDKFFDDVLVMDKDPDTQKNRLGLLSSIGGLFGQIADFRKIVSP